jgi:hypothetical protein
MDVPQYADETVSRKKFEREIAEFRKLRREYHQRGWFLVQAVYPHVLVLMASRKLQPSAIVTGVAFDYTNYDAAPPSVHLVNPFTEAPYKSSELPTQLLRALPEQQLQFAGAPAGAPAFAVQAAQPLMQAISPEDVPFLCLAGVREYHDHPAHSGDVWDLHRASGAGRLVRLLDVIHRYGVEPIAAWGVQMMPKVTFHLGQPPV